MPLATINIAFPGFKAFEGGAGLFSWLAYSDPQDHAVRKVFFEALCRWYILRRSESDRTFAWNAAVRPAYFTLKNPEGIYKRGRKRIFERMVVARFVAIPHYVALSGSERWRPEGFDPIVGNMLDIARWDLGWGQDSESRSTAMTKLWKPTRPVVHVAAALWMVGQANPFPRFEDGTGDLEHLIEACLRIPKILAQVLVVSEELRLLLPHIKQFTIVEEETYQFVCALDPAPE